MPCSLSAITRDAIPVMITQILDILTRFFSSILKRGLRISEVIMVLVVSRQVSADDITAARRAIMTRPLNPFGMVCTISAGQCDFWLNLRQKYPGGDPRKCDNKGCGDHDRCG